MMRNLMTIAAVGVGMTVGSAAMADTISFDPDGPGGASGPLSVASFDFLPGNSLARNAGAADDPQGVSYTQFAQGRLGALLDENSESIPVPGLNQDFEITITAEYGGVAAELLPGLLQLGLDPGADVRQVTLYFDDDPNANDLTGEGFADGDVIMEAVVSEAGGVFQVVNPNGGNFDQLGNNDFPGISSVRGNGALTVNSDVASFDSDFFLTPILEFLVNTNSIAPFTDANPSEMFTDSNGDPVIPNIGLVNGLGEDIQLQTDATGSFIVPEPATAALLALGGMVMMRRRRD